MPAPSKRTPQVEEAILSRIALGEPLAVICRESGMPHVTTWMDWVHADEVLAIAYARAREVGFDMIAADALRIIDAEPERVVTTTGEDRAETRIDSASVQWAKNRVETRLKLLAKWDPKRYGELLKHSGADGTSPAMTALAVAFVRPGEQSK